MTPRNLRLSVFVVLAAAAAAVAQVDFNAPAIDAGNDIARNLSALMKTNARVQVSLKGGRTVVGYIGSVGKEYFVMRDLDEGKDKGALVHTDDISVITYQAKRAE